MAAAVGACGSGTSGPGGGGGGGGTPDANPNGCRVDPDGDGWGDGCLLGLDCKEGDPTQNGREICDGRDNDCDAEIDEGVTNACGDCDPGCVGEAIGVGQGTGFDPAGEDSEGLGLDDDGALILDSTEIETHFIWIANTGEGTVSKVDTRSLVEVARYRTGPAGAANDPSRTSVNSLGDVYVANRGGMSLTKISVLGSGCPDTNGDGSVTTSTGPGDVMPWGQDDCVLWHTPLAGTGIIRAVAAQDRVGPDGELVPYVWAGGWGGWVWKLDGVTGQVLFKTPSPTLTYGFALDGAGNLWISGRSQGSLGRLDTNLCVDEASCAGAVCGADGDTCVKQRIPLPSGAEPYGITVDVAQRVWMACHGSLLVARYDPAAAAGERWRTQNVGANCHGIAADGNGWVWAAGGGIGVIRLWGDDPLNWRVVAGTAGASAKGMAVDMDGKIWTINISHNDATVITPGAGVDDATVQTDVASGLVHPYTYSDMTGQQLRLATNQRGYYRKVFQGCEGGETEWGELAWDATTPEGTVVRFRVRTADTREALAAAAWVLVAETPPAAPPADVTAALVAAAVTPGAWLELEVQLEATRTSSVTVITPTVRSFGVTHRCPAAVP